MMKIGLERTNCITYSVFRKYMPQNYSANTLKNHNVFVLSEKKKKTSSSLKGENREKSV
jgi:hypothetical protein